MSLDLGVLHPEITKGVVSISGCLRDSTIAHITDSEALKSKSMLLVHGNKDDVILPRFFMEAIELLEAQGIGIAQQKVNAGHQHTPEMVEIVQQWLTEQLNKSNSD